MERLQKMQETLAKRLIKPLNQSRRLAEKTEVFDLGLGLSSSSIFSSFKCLRSDFPRFGGGSEGIMGNVLCSGLA